MAWLDDLLASLPASSSQTTSPSQGVPYTSPVSPVNDLLQGQTGSPVAATDSNLSSLMQPPPVLANVSSQLPNATQGQQPGGFLHALGQAFQANPNGLQHMATSDPGVIGSLLPQGSGAQNFLGKLGDAFLVANGHPAVHREFAQQQALAQAQAPMYAGSGPFDANGNISDSAKQAIADTAKIDPQAAQTMQSNLIQAQLHRDQLMREKANTESEIGARDAEMQNKQLSNARAMLSSANAANYPVVKALAEKYLNAKGIDSSLLNLPDTYDPDAIKNIELAGVPVTRQFQMTETAQHHRELENIGEQNAASNRGKVGAMYANAGANNARAGADVQRSNVDAQRLAADIQGGKTGPNTVHGGSGHHVFGGAAVTPPPFAPGKVGRTVTNGTHTFYSPDGKTWVAH